MKRMIVAGSRGFEDAQFLFTALSLLTVDYRDDLIVVSGGARGADQLGEKWAFEHGVDVEVCPADWERHGKAAGPIRNNEMAKIADMAVVFWDGESRGSRHMIESALENKLELHVYFV